MRIILIIILVITLAGHVPPGWLSVRCAMLAGDDAMLITAHNRLVTPIKNLQR